MKPLSVRWILLALLTFAVSARAAAQSGSFPEEDPPASLSSQSLQEWLATLSRAIERNSEQPPSEIDELHTELIKTPVDRAWYTLRLAQTYEALRRDNSGEESRRDYANKAIAAWRDCAEQFATLPGSQPEELLARGSLGVALIRDGRPDDHQSLARALALGTAEERRPGEAHSNLVTIGRALQRIDPDWSRKFFEAARDKAVRYAPQSFDLLQDVEALARTHLRTGRLTDAIPDFQQARGIAQRLQQILSTLSTGDQAQLDQAVKARDGALAQELRAQLNQRRSRLDGFLEADARALLGIAAASRFLGDYHRAVETNTEAGKVLKDVFPGSRAFIDFLLQRADIAIDRHEFRDASRALRDAIGLTSGAGDDPDGLLRAVSLYGRLELERRNLDRAIQYLYLAEDGFRGMDGQLTDRALNDEYIAQWAYARDIVDGARTRLDRVQRDYERWSMPLDAARVRLLRAAHDPDWDKVRRQRELESVRTIVAGMAPRSALMASIELWLGYQDNSPEEDEPHFRAALDILRDVAPRSLAMVRVLRNLGDVAPVWPDKERWKRESWELIRSMSPEFAGDDAMQEYAYLLQASGVLLASVLVSNAKIEDAFAVMERSRANNLLRQLAGKRNLGGAWKQHQLLLGQRELTASRYEETSSAEFALAGALEKLEKNDASADEIEEMRSKLSKQRDKLSSARAELIGFLAGTDAFWESLEPYRVPPTQGPISWREQLDPGTVLVMFAVGQDTMLDGHRTLLVAAVQRDQDVEIARVNLDRIILEGPCRSANADATRSDAMDLYEAVDCLNGLVARAPARGESESDAADLSRTAHAVFATLFPPAIRQRVLTATRLVIAPDRFLWRVPFAALKTSDGAGASFLGGLVPLNYTTSLEAWSASRAERSNVSSGSGVTALVVEGTSGTLAGTAAEARQVSCAYKSTLLSGGEATESKVRSAIEAADLVHIATHGRADERYSMQSTLRLVGSTDVEGQRTNDDGQLQAWEVFSQLRLRAELVVLSACETGQGPVVAGDGILGLPRAFQYAGARSIIASMWKVPDAATAELMTSFYRALGQGAAKDTALRDAMQHVQATTGFAHPYNWAAFELYGNPENGGLRATASCPSQ